MSLRCAIRLAALLSVGIASAVCAQSFDNFGGEPLEGFEIGPGGIGEIEVPSLGENGSVGIGPEIQLQSTTGQSGVGLITIPGTGTPVTSVSQPATEQAGRVILRALDKTLGRPTDIDMAVGETVVFGRVAIQLVECRYPANDPSSDAYAHLQVFDLEGNPLFDGWMVASSPALSALEHPRYDVWVLRCEDTAG